MALTRTAKSCGSDAPMLASSLREEAQMTVSNKLVTGKSTKETVKPLRGECRVISGVTVVTTLVCSLHLSHARLRVRRAPGIPCALVFPGRTFLQNSGRSCREIAETYPLGCFKIESIWCNKLCRRLRPKPGSPVRTVSRSESLRGHSRGTALFQGFGNRIVDTFEPDEL